MSQTIYIQLDVWRAAKMSNEIIDIANNESMNSSSLFICVYSWKCVHDVFGSISDMQATDLLRQSIEKFDPSIPSHIRKPEELNSILTCIDSILESAAWSSTSEVWQVQPGETINLRQNQLLALRIHLQWICSTFGYVPETCISIR
jgi:hypothetical protein